MKQGLVFFLLVFFLSACSTAVVRILPGEDGVNQVVVRDIERDNTESEATKAASKYCKQRGKEAYYINQDNVNAEYKGEMKEKDRNMIRKGSKAAMILGPGLGMGTGHHAVGGLLGGAGMVGHVMTNDRDYEARLKFKCK